MTENLLVVAGIDDRDHFQYFVDDCRDHGVTAEVYVYGFQDIETPLDVLDQRLLDKIDSISRLTIVGISAGGCKGGIRAPGAARAC